MAASEEIIINAILAGTREYLANAQRVAGANAEMASSTARYGRVAEHTSRRGFLMNQMMFTLRRTMYGLTLATIGAGAVAVKWGFNFNSAMQQARVALNPVLGGTRGVNKELDYLFNFTKYTPFQFKDMTIAFRQMFFGFRALGISAGFTNKVLKAMVDNLAATGKDSPGQLNRVSVALQHMANLGHLSGQNVQQLARDGIQIYPALRKELGLTAEQMHNIGRMNIPVDVAMRAIVKYIETTPGLMNAAHRQAIHTFHGLFTTFKDNMSQLMGQVEKGWFGRIQHWLKGMNAFFDTIAKSKPRSITDVMAGVNNQLTPGSNAIITFWRRLSGAISLLWSNFEILISDIAHSKVIWGTLYIGLTLMYGVLKFLNYQMHPLVLILTWMLPLWVAWKLVMMANAFWLGVIALEEITLKKTTRELTFAQFLYSVIMGKFNIISKITTALLYLQVRATNTLNDSMAAGVAERYLAVATKLRWVLAALKGIGLITTLIVIGYEFSQILGKGHGHSGWYNFAHDINSKTGKQGFLGQAVFGIAHAIEHPFRDWTPPNVSQHAVRSGTTTPVATPQFNLQEAWMRTHQPPPIKVDLNLDKRLLESVTVDTQTGRVARQ